MATIAEKLAASLLAVSGRQAISDIYGAVATAYERGKPEVAGALIEIAEAAEREWMRRGELEATDHAA